MGERATASNWDDSDERYSCRSKTKTLTKLPKSVADLPDWNYDGSSCKSFIHVEMDEIRPTALEPEQSSCGL